MQNQWFRSWQRATQGSPLQGLSGIGECYCVILPHPRPPVSAVSVYATYAARPQFPLGAPTQRGADFQRDREGELDPANTKFVQSFTQNETQGILRGQRHCRTRVDI